jgi:maleate isomerase
VQGSEIDAMFRTLRIGQIVPSSNTTMETEIPAMLRAREVIRPERFTFHSSRMRMKTVTADELAAMDRESDRCAVELSDAQVDVLGYACLVAIMSMGRGYHRLSQQRLNERARAGGRDIPVVTSAGALIDSLHAMKIKTVSLVAPYLKPLTRTVVEYIESEGIVVKDYRALEISDNLAVGRHDSGRLPEIVRQLDTSGVDAVVLSACVQMPSLPVVAKVEAQTGKPVVTAAIATAYQLLRALQLDTIVPGAGALLSGAY